MTPDEDLEEKVLAARMPVYMTDKLEIVEYYRDHPRPGQSWKQAIIADLGPITHLKKKSLEKRFERRLTSGGTAKTREEYRKLGRTLPPIGFVSPKAYRVTFRGSIKISNDCYPRSKTVIVPAPPDGMITTYDILRAYWNGNKPDGERFCDEADGERPPTLTVNPVIS